MNTQILDVYLCEQLIGKLTQEKSGNLKFQYDLAYAIHANSIPLSISLPLGLEPYEGQNVKAFFSGVLPDDIVRHKLARYLGISERNPFALLEVVGGECAGAISLYPEGITPISPKDEDIEKLNEKQLEELLDLLKRRPLLAGTDGVRLSLAGAQDKIAVRIIEGEVALVKGTSPTSHILKPVIEGIMHSVHNEFFCMRLAKLIQIKTPHVEIRWLNDVPYFLVERYDRQIQNNQLTRLHQEDFCQALGVLPEFKYEREGGPSIPQCISLLQKVSLYPVADSDSFIKRLIFNYMIGNSDAHGKNFSLLYLSNKPVLAPAYDLMSTAIYSNLSAKMAMKIGKVYEPEKVLLRYWHQIIPDTATAKNSFNKKILKMARDCIEHSQTLKESLKGKKENSPIFNDICVVIQNRAQSILDQF